VFQISKQNQTIVRELQNMFSQCLYLPKIYVVCEDCKLLCVCVCVYLIHNADESPSDKKTSHVFIHQVKL